MSLPAALPFTRARLRLLFVLGASVLLSLLLIAGRVLVTGHGLFLFLAWNLLLALIPYALSTLLGLAAGPQQVRLLLPLGAMWLLFFPNAPYILTDLFHLEPVLHFGLNLGHGLYAELPQRCFR